MNAVQGELIVSGSADETQLILDDVDRNERKTFYLRVVTGTIKIGVGEIDAAANGWAAVDGAIEMSCYNGELYFKAAADTDTFVLTASPA